MLKNITGFFSRFLDRILDRFSTVVIPISVVVLLNATTKLCDRLLSDIGRLSNDYYGIGFEEVDQRDPV